MNCEICGEEIKGKVIHVLPKGFEHEECYTYVHYKQKYQGENYEQIRLWYNESFKS